MNHRPILFALVLSLALASPCAAPAAELKILFPLERTAYQTNERIDLSVVRSGAEALSAGTLALAVSGEDGSQLQFAFPVPAVPVAGTGARRTEHLHLDGWLLRPGKYTVAVTADGASATAAIELFSHVRQTTFKLIDWGSGAQGADLTKLGEQGLGFNLIYGNYRLGPNILNAEATLRGGADFMQVCTMSGGHQMDLRGECDWSDPLVIRGGTARVTQQAFFNRTAPNCLGVHFYDEPGLTWWTHPKTGKNTPHNVPAQDLAFRGAYGIDPLQYCDVKPDNPVDFARWLHWGRWKLSFMDAAWKDARYGVDQVRDDLLSATQSVYGFTAYADGYYFNVVRSLPVISGHGGYDDGPSSYLYPSFHHEFGRIRDLDKPNWYLPAWYGGMSGDQFRLEQYLSFMTGLQGMAKPPGYPIQSPAQTPGADGIIEANRLMGRLGTIFNTLPVARGEVALLYSMSQNLNAQAHNMDDNYEGGGHTRARLLDTYIAGKISHIPFFPIVEEDVTDGTLAAHHKAVILAGIDYLDPTVIAALEQYARSGGAVLVTDDCKVQIPGATKVGAPASTNQYNLVGEFWRQQNPKESMRQRAAWRFMKDAEPLAAALQTQLAKLGIKPVLACDNPSVFATRQDTADVEYLFAVNATGDEKADSHIAIQPATARITFPNDGHAVYDAVRGGAVAELKGNSGPARIQFGPGQLRAFARTARPIAGVELVAPVTDRDYLRADQPFRLRLVATVVDAQKLPLAGAIPLAIRLTDPLGVVRYDLLRATDQGGTCRLDLPLAANDPAGAWQVEVRELLNNTRGSARFSLAAVTQCGALAGATSRAVYFGNDRANIYRFFRHDAPVTIVKGTADYEAAAAERLAASLKPWGVRCTIVNAADVNKSRELTADQAKTWVGIEFGRAQPGATNSPAKTGFAFDGAAILLGTPEDNPLIATVARLGFLPYKPGSDFPGRGRGYLAWQRDAIGIGQESVTVIATDAAGLAEGVGTLFEAAAGLDPLTPLQPPATAAVAVATKAPGLVPEAIVAWEVALPDRARSLQATANGQIEAWTEDGSLNTVSAAGKLVSQKPGAGAAAPAPAAPKPGDAIAKNLRPSRVVKHVAAGNGLTAVACWGGSLQIFDTASGTLKTAQLLPQDVTGLAWLNNRLVVGLSDGRLLGLTVR